MESRRMVVVMAMTMMGAGCGPDAAKIPQATDPGALRVRADPARDRTWVLGLDAVQVYEGRSRRPVARIELPGWSVADFICPPDLVLDASGSAYVSSNVQPVLWKIDGAAYAATARTITLQGRERWDTGFGALAIAADGTLAALTASGGSLWRVDWSRGDAGLVRADTRLANTCEIGQPLLSETERRNPK